MTLITCGEGSKVNGPGVLPLDGGGVPGPSWTCSGVGSDCTKSLPACHTSRERSGYPVGEEVFRVSPRATYGRCDSTTLDAGAVLIFGSPLPREGSVQITEVPVFPGKNCDDTTYVVDSDASHRLIRCVTHP